MGRPARGHVRNAGLAARRSRRPRPGGPGGREALSGLGLGGAERAAVRVAGIGGPPGAASRAAGDADVPVPGGAEAAEDGQAGLGPVGPGRLAMREIFMPNDGGVTASAPGGARRYFS
ncbi:MAG TPA: hypothetical protein VKV80_21975 [Streptosporangiaceae bacterium]|nr:hypothetical protein [Streptosporangiaceae bacterium]